MKNETDFARYLTKFLGNYLPHQRNVSPKTVSSYSTSFYLFLSFMLECKEIDAGKVTLADFTKSNIEDFLGWLSDKRSCREATINNRRAAMCSFAKYLQYEVVDRMTQWQRIMGIPPVKSPKQEVNYLEMEVISLLFKQIDTCNNHGRRNMALLTLMYNTGCRVQELIDLTPSSLRLENGNKTIRIKGKGAKTRIVPMLDEQLDHLLVYMQDNNLDKNENAMHPLFFNAQGRKLTRAGVSHILHEYVAKARMINPKLCPDKVGCHTLRHSRAMHLLQEGCPLIYIRDLLGHVSIQTTEIYARADSKQKRHALENAYKNLTPDSEKEAIWEKDTSILDWLEKMKK